MNYKNGGKLDVEKLVAGNLSHRKFVAENTWQRKFVAWCNLNTSSLSASIFFVLFVFVSATTKSIVLFPCS